MDRRQTTEELINQLNELISEAWTMPLSGGKAVVDRERVTDLLNEINSTFPEELQQARAIVSAQEELKAAAERDADAIIRDAETRARRLVEDQAVIREARRLTSELVNQKKAEAQNILNDANAKSIDLIKKSEQHAEEVTRKAEKESHNLRTATAAYIENSVSGTEQAMAESLNRLRQIKQQVRSGATQQ